MNYENIARGWKQKMDNSNFWDWDNEDEHRVSAVYQDIAEEAGCAVPTDTTNNTEAQNDVPLTDAGKVVEAQAVEAQTTIEAQIVDVPNKAGQNNPTQNNLTQSNLTQNNEPQNTETAQEPEVPPTVMTENNFILIDNPQNPTQNPAQNQNPQFAQSQYEQPRPQNKQPQQDQPPHPGFQQIIPVHNSQQNQGTNSQTNTQTNNTSYQHSFDQKDISENKVSAMAAYLLGPIGIIIALLIARDSAYTAFHVRQALKLTICSVVLELMAAVLALFGMIPFVGIIFKLVLAILCVIWLGILVLRLIAIAQVCDGEAREPAVIGKMNCFH